MENPRSAAWTAWRWTLLGGFALVAALNMPGHLPLDSISGLWEGRTHVRMSWGPRMYSLILGVFDHIVPGAGLFAMTCLAVTAFAWLALPLVRRRIAWSGPVALALAFALPQVLIYQGIVWRDVLFADLSVAAFVALALADRFWASQGLRWPLLLLAVGFLALGALVRQNGGVVIVPWALALGWIGGRGRWRPGLGWAGAGLAAPVLLAVALNLANPIHEPPGRNLAIGPRLLAHYDLMAALAEAPQRPMPELAADRPQSLALLRREAPSVYSPTRIDTLDWNKSVQFAIWRFDTGRVEAQWREMILADPLGYARRRLEVFRWVFLTPDLVKCVPLHLGVDGLPQVEKDLGLQHGHWIQDGRLYAYAQRWFGTPVFSHLTYALAAAATAVLLLFRRQAGDVAIAGLQVGALGFTATFLLLSIACDYRYLYALDLAAITGVLYLAVDPSTGRGKAASKASRTSA